MDAVAALAAPFLKDLTVDALPDFLGRRGVRVLHAHDGAPFGVLVKALLHGRLGTELRCARLDLRTLDADSIDTRRLVQPWINLAGLQGAFPPPAGYYLFRGPTLVGYHPELPHARKQASRLASLGTRGFVRLVQERDLDRVGRQVIEDEPELQRVRFCEEVAQGGGPRRAPAAGDRRQEQDRRNGARGGTGRRAREKAELTLGAAFELLGLPRTADMRRVKAARNRLMRDNHPDRLAHVPERQAEATRMTVRINEAYAAIRRVREEHGDRA